LNYKEHIQKRLFNVNTLTIIRKKGYGFWKYWRCYGPQVTKFRHPTYLSTYLFHFFILCILFRARFQLAMRN